MEIFMDDYDDDEDRQEWLDGNMELDQYALG